MKKTFSSMLINELSFISGQIDLYESELKTTLVHDEIEFYKFMCSIYSENVKKMHQKLNKEKQTNKKFKFISE
jgi:hypothetical protein